MPRNRKTTIRSLALAVLGILALSIRAVAVEPATNAEGLWVSDLNHVSEFQGVALQESGTPSANLSFGIKRDFDQFSIAFDRHGNLWMTAHPANSHDFPIIKVSRAEIASLKSSKQAKGEVVTPGKGRAETAWFGIAFDAAGDLWITNPAQQALMEFLPRQIKTGRIGSPAVLISAVNFSPGEIRFDASDNLWAAAGNSQLWRFAPGNRESSGPPKPGLIVNLPNGIGLVDFAFNSTGNLWLAGPVFPGPVLVDELEMISASDLADAGEISPSAAVTITSSAFPMQSAGLSAGTCFGGIDFDHLGDLWVSAHCVPDALVVEFTPAQLSMGGDLNRRWRSARMPQERTWYFRAQCDSAPHSSRAAITMRQRASALAREILRSAQDDTTNSSNRGGAAGIFLLSLGAGVTPAETHRGFHIQLSDLPFDDYLLI